MCTPDQASSLLELNRRDGVLLRHIYPRAVDSAGFVGAQPTFEDACTEAVSSPGSLSRMRKLLVGAAALAASWGVALGVTESPAGAVGPLSLTLNNKTVECSYNFGSSTNYGRAANGLKRVYEQGGFGTLDETTRINIIYRMEQHKWQLDESSVECHKNPNAPVPAVKVPKTEQPVYKAGQGVKNVAKGVKESGEILNDGATYILGPGDCIKYGIDGRGNCYRNEDYYVNDNDSTSGRTIQCRVKRGQSDNWAIQGHRAAQLTADQLGTPLRTDYRAYLYGQLYSLIVKGARFSEEDITCYDITPGSL